MLTEEKCCEAIKSLIAYAGNVQLLDKLDEVYAINSLIRVMGLDAYTENEGNIEFPRCLELLCDYAAENNMIENTAAQRDLFDTLLMGVLTPNPSVVIKEFNRLYKEKSKDATDYFYKLSKDSNYIRRDRILVGISPVGLQT